MPAPKKYSDELRARATRLALESGRPIAQVTRDLGIHKEALRTWVRQARADAAGGTPSVLSSAERERLRELEREVRELRQANEVLKAASVFLARPGGGRRRRTPATAQLTRRFVMSRVRGLRPFVRFDEEGRGKVGDPCVDLVRCEAVCAASLPRVPCRKRRTGATMDTDRREHPASRDA